MLILMLIVFIIVDLFTHIRIITPVERGSCKHIIDIIQHHII